MAQCSQGSWTITLTNMYFGLIAEHPNQEVYCSIACSNKLL